MKFSKWCIVCLVVIIWMEFACNPTGRKKESDTNLIDTTITLKTVYKRGIINTITALNNPMCSYCFYVPKDSLPEYPVVILLDPHAKGTYTVSLYQQLAEKYKVILISSNNIRNQMSINEINSYISQIFSDAKEFLDIDSTRLYIGGFSGTARTVYELISRTNMYRGALAVGAGASASIPWKDSTFCLIQMAGFRDMNFQEVYESHLTLRNTSVLYMGFFYEGEHQWPADTIMEYVWLNFFARYQSDLAEPFLNKMISYAKTIPLRDRWKKTLLYAGLKTLCYNIKYYQAPFNEINNYLNTFESKNSLKQFQTLLKNEQKEKEMLYQAFIEKDSLWWSKTIKFYNEVKKKNNLSPSDYKDIRLANFISLLAYSYTQSALQQSRMDLARKYLSIYQSIDPYNEDMLYFWSVYFAKLNEPKRSLDSLSKAIKLGFNDKIILQNEPAFYALKDSVRFIDIVAKMR